MFILSQVLVFISDVFFATSMLNKNKKGLVFYLIISDILFACHYVCLDGWTGVVTALVDIIYLVLIYILERKGATRYNIYVSIVTMSLTILLSILTWDGAISLLPMFAMLVYFVAMIFSSVIIVKAGSFIRNALNSIYMFMLSSYLGAALGVCLMISAVVGIILDIRHLKRKSGSMEI